MSFPTRATPPVPGRSKGPASSPDRRQGGTVPPPSGQTARQDRLRAWRAATGAGIALAAALFGMACRMRIDVIAERSFEPDASTPGFGGAMSDASAGATTADASGA